MRCELFRADHVRPGWICCRCTSYNGKAQPTCWSCGHQICDDPTETVMTAPKPRRGRPPAVARRGPGWSWRGKNGRSASAPSQKD